VKALGRPELEKAIAALGPNDVLILAEWDRSNPVMLDAFASIERVAARGALLKALDRQWLDLTTPLGKASLLSCRPWLRTSALVFWRVPMGAGQPPRKEASIRA